ncbi:efflux RND transporter permease subunit [Novosphingobium pentaromativorans]|uniref:Acriflavin resistance protein n=1 Tax=Novosphingobium pentaromativorans US6-1 TaxID=1088721 RepID=G6EDJ9_9SPHN|nr:efflux RND transporter permease subunit [Novosphingobium pentaromativorans]AIT79726.1 transporter [Novosphingobium pentaromativorans US6-1]EHJ60627.1 acriflavin resistance protein [Novosphingobium pentaromativorans US6-1]
MKSRLSRHARALWLAMILLTLGGVFGALKLPVSLFPQIDYPRVVVSIDAGERDAAQMEAAITRPMEIALRSVPGVTRIRSTTSRGSAEIQLNFNWGHNMPRALLAVQGMLATIQPDLPSGTRYDAWRADPTVFPVYGIALTSPNLDQEALRQIAVLKVRPALTGITGVAAVDILGGSPRTFEVDVDPAKLTALGLSPDDVSTALSKANVVRGAGRLQDRHRLYLLLVQNRLKDAADIAATPIRAGAMPGGGLVTVGDVASVRSAVEPNYTLVTSNGQNAVLINVRQTFNGDTVQVAHDVAAKMKTLGLPPSVKVTPFYDQSQLVTGAANAVRDAILIGAVLAGLVLFVFLRSVRLMAITAAVLPAVLAGTCVVLFALGMHFDMMTLGGMAAAVGLIIDDAVVMLEHMMRRMQEGEATDTPGLLSAAAEMGKPLFGSTGATIVVFLPLAFISGVTGGFFKALAITMVAALAISLVYARFLIPLLAAHWLRPKDAEAAENAGGFMGWITRTYDRAFNRTFARPLLFVAIVGIGLAAGGYYSYKHVPSGFMPKMDEGGFILDYKAQPGAALHDTNHLLKQVEQIIQNTPEVASYSRRTGAQLGGGLTEADEGDYFIRLKGGSRRPIWQVMDEIRHKIDNRVPGLQIETAQLMEDLIGDLTAVPQPIEIKLFGDNPKELAASAKKVGDAIGKINGVGEVVDGLRVAGDAIAVKVNPGAALQQGLDPETLGNQLEALVGGTQSTQVRVGEQLIGVRVRGPADVRERASQIGELPITAPDGHTVRVSQIADVSILAGQKQRTREDLAPFIDVTARLEGRDLGSAMQEVRKTVSGLNMPRSIRVEYGGMYAQQQKSFTDLAIVFAAALLLSALLLTLLYERIGWTLAALTTVLMSAAIVLCGLWITGIELDISALMGLTMVVGMVTELIVFFFAEIDPERPVDLAALHEAGSKRLRPILMSALIAVLTLSPLALGMSRGAGLQRPLATAIIFGLTAAVPLVLLFLPALLQASSRVTSAARNGLGRSRNSGTSRE